MFDEGDSLWRRIGKALIGDIETGVIAPGARLPADTDLATRFGVNRHTVRRALSHLQGEGLLRSERGRGTFVVDDVLDYRLGARTRFTENLLAGARVPGRTLLSVTEMPAPAEIAEQLAILPGDPVVLAVVLGKSDGAPLSHGRNYFPSGRLPSLADHLRQALDRPTERFSITEALRRAGVPTYRRRHTRITGRMPTAEEARHLKMPASECVLETESVDVNSDNRPVNHAHTCFRSSRVQFVLDS